MGGNLYNLWESHKSFHVCTTIQLVHVCFPKARVRAHDWVREVEQPVAMEAAEEAVEEKGVESTPSTESGEDEGSIDKEEENEEQRNIKEDASDGVEVKHGPCVTFVC